MEDIHCSPPYLGGPTPGVGMDGIMISPGEATWEGPDGCGETLTIRWNKEPQDVSAFAKRWELPQVRVMYIRIECKLLDS